VAAASSADLIVLGAGPAGLAAAWRAALRGLEVTVLDRSDRVGGLAASFDVGGVRVDHGSHRLHPATPPDILDELKQLLGEDLQTRRRNGRLRIAGTWVDFPLSGRQLARSLPAPMLVGIAKDAAAAPLRRVREDSYAGVLRAGLGPTVYRALYEPFAVKLWGLPGDRIAAEQARRRVTADTPWKVAARIARRKRGGSGAGTFLYPRRGFGQIVDTLAEQAQAAGAQIRLRTDVDVIAPSFGSVRVSSRDGFAVTGRHAFSTLPLTTLARLTHPGPSLVAIEAATRLHFRAMVLVYIVHEGGRWTPYDAHYLPGDESPVSRISEPANYRESADDPAGRSVICAEVPCAVGDEIWTATDEDHAWLVDLTLERCELPALKRSDVVVRRLPTVYPVYERGFERHLSGLEAWVRAVPSVTTFGRLGLFVHDNTHHALVMARDAVAALDDAGRFDTLAWDNALDRFARHVVED
jgi:protoporphyrinogen oxidase